MKGTYWGKTCAGNSWHHLCHHCLDVAAAAEALLEANPYWRQRLCALSPYAPEQTVPLLLFLAACHDLGKFGGSFQYRLPPGVLFVPPLGRNTVQQFPRAHHTCLGLNLWDLLQPQNFLPLPDPYALKPLLSAALCHHGVPVQKLPNAKRCGLTSVVQEDAREYLCELGTLFQLSPVPAVEEKALRKLSWAAAGFFILADWIGSNETWFTPEPVWRGVAAYFPTARKRAVQALADLPMRESAPGSATDFHTLLPHLRPEDQANPMQRAVLDLPAPSGPELLIIEDLTGGGKTEAALLAAHRFMRGGQAYGLYVGLPTMATANAMYGRLCGSYRRLFADADASLVLAHGGRALHEKYLASIMPNGLPEGGDDADDTESAAVCSAWLSDSRKKSLLAPCGVGTIDQALLAVLQAKHQSLRLLGLCRSVLVVDEVHAYDTYTGALLKNLLTFQAALGGSAILLSATLPRRLRAELMEAWAAGRGRISVPPSSQAFPLLTRVTEAGCTEQGVEAARRLEVRIRPVHDEAAMYTALKAASAAGACACWIRNTVGDVLEARRVLLEEYGVPPEKVQVFHARFTGMDRRRIEGDVVRRFGKCSAPEERAGHILLASQVAEQSLDIDFDVLLSDLAPMELLIQRAGRCHRHGRRRPAGYETALVQVLMPEPVDAVTATWYADMFPAGQYVYQRPALLWRTARLLCAEGKLSLPERARFLVEGAYGADLPAPETLEKAEWTTEGKDQAARSNADFVEVKITDGYLSDTMGWDAEIRFPTRLGDPARNGRLLRMAEDGSLRLWAHDDDEALTMRHCLLSEVRVREAALKEAINPPQCAEALEALKRTMPDKGKWCLCLVLRETAPGLWTGHGRNGRGEEITVAYSPESGLRLGD